MNKVNDFLKPIFTKKIETISVGFILDQRKHSSYIKNLKEAEMLTDINYLKNEPEVLPAAIRVSFTTDKFNLYFYRTGGMFTLYEWEKMRHATGTSNFAKQRKEQEKIFDKVCVTISELQTNRTFNIENLKKKLTGRLDLNFSELWLQMIDKLRLEGRAGTADSYNNAFISFSKSVGSNISFNSIGFDIVNKWTNIMTNNGLSPTTIGIYHRGMRVVANEAQRLGYIEPNQYPFGKGTDKVTIRKGRSKTEAYLPVSDILKLKDYDTPEKREKYHTKWICEAINMFLFSYLANGMNLMDICLLTYNDHYFNSEGKELMFVRKKTEATSESEIQIIIPIIPELQKILDYYASTPLKDSYVFPNLLNGETDPIKIKAIVKDLNADFGFRLKKAGKEVGISKPISMTYARHSFATNLTHAGVSERYIPQAMGHSNKNVTGGYIAPFSPQKRVMFNSLLLKKEGY